MAKTAQLKMAPKEVVVLTPEQMIAEVRRLRAGGLFVGNMEFVDALLAEYSKLVHDHAVTALALAALEKTMEAHRADLQPV
jgi:hypothetical protein